MTRMTPSRSTAPSAPPAPESAPWRRIAVAIAHAPALDDRTIAAQLHVATAHVTHIRAAMARAEARRPKPQRTVSTADELRAAILARPDAPARLIADEVGVIISQVWKARAELVQEGKLAPPRRGAAPTPRPPRPAAPRQRERWEIESEALLAQIRAETDWYHLQDLRLRLLRARWVPWAKGAAR